MLANLWEQHKCKKTKEVYVNEPNTIPGSLSFYMFKPDGLEYRELINELSKDSWCLRLLVITCKENNVSDSIIHIIHCYSVCS